VKTVQELVQDISRGDLQLPEFQRGYVWSPDKVRALVESLYRKRPTGHLLTWHAYEPVATKGGGERPHGKQVLILDGQQRLTSLYVLFKGEAPPFYDGEPLIFNLYFNVQTQEFRFYQRSLMTNNPAWRDVSQLFRSGGIHALLNRLQTMSAEERAIVEPHLGRLGQLDDIRNHRYQVDELTDESLAVDDVVEIFNQVNSAGTPLSRADLAMAHVCVKWPEARAELRTFTHSMAREGFGLEPELLIRAVAGTAGETVNFTSTFNRIPADRLKAAWPKVRQSFEYLVNILREHAFIARLDDLASPFSVLPVLIYLARNGSEFRSAKDRDRFLRWMFLANVWNRYAGQTDTRLQRDVNHLGSEDPTARLVDEIMSDRGRVAIEARDLEGKGPQTALYRFGYVMARSRSALDWFNGAPLYVKAVGRSNALESHHVFPRSVLRKSQFGEDSRAINEIANRAFLTKKTNLGISNKHPAKYLPQVEKKYPGALGAQCIPMDATLWKIDNFPTFLHERRKLLAKVMNRFLDKLGHSSDNVVGAAATIGALLEREEGSQLEFKSSLRWDVDRGDANREIEKVVVKTVAGFLNGRGGTLLIGVNNDRQVVGLAKDYEILRKPGRDDRDVFLQHLVHLLSTGIGETAASFVTATCHSVQGKEVCQVVIYPSNQPVYFTDGPSMTFYLRIGNMTRPVPINETVRYTESHWGDGPPGYVPQIPDETEAAAGGWEPPTEFAGWIEGVGAFEQALELAHYGNRPQLDRLMKWALEVNEQGLLGGLWSRGGTKPALSMVPKTSDRAMVRVNDDGSLAIYRSVVEDCAPNHIERLEELLRPVPLGKGRAVKRPSQELLDGLVQAFRDAGDIEARLLRAIFGEASEKEGEATAVDDKGSASVASPDVGADSARDL
jgi:hypothetical protein